MWVQSLGQEDPLEKDMATCSSILAWKTPWTEDPGRLQLRGLKESDTNEQLSTHMHAINFLFPFSLHVAVEKSDVSSTYFVGNIWVFLFNPEFLKFIHGNQDLLRCESFLSILVLTEPC